MKPHPRIRKTVKWGGAVVTVLLVVVWIGSGWLCGFVAPSSRALTGVDRGRLGLAWFDASSEYPVNLAEANRFSHGLSIRLGWYSERLPDATLTWIPLWPLLLIAMLSTLTAWRLDTLARRRARLNLCPKCDYDRTGLAAGAVCPECGVAPLHKAAEKQAADDTDAHG